MEVMVLGLNHKTAPLGVREKLSVPSHKASDLMDAFRSKGIFEERVILSTCNRTEIYGVGRRPDEDILKAKAFLSDYASLDLPQFEDKLYVLNQPDSVNHLFSVASGLDSMVVGETEILGQVKSAYLLAHEKGQTGKVLNQLFQRSLRVAKNVRTQTDIGLGRVSVASVSVDLAQKIFEQLKGVRVMVLGTGEMATQVAKALVSKGAYPYVISSRHHDRAEEMIKNLGGGAALHFNDYEEHIKDVDVLIASTEALRALIETEQVKRWMKIRQQKPFFMIDIAMPRNIQPEINKLDNVYLYNIDDLQGIASKNLALRESQMDQCMDLVRNQTQYFMGWLTKEFGFDGKKS